MKFEKRSLAPLYIVRDYINWLKTSSVYSTVCPGSSDPFYIVTYYIKWGHYFLDIQYYITNSYSNYYINGPRLLVQTVHCIGAQTKMGNHLIKYRWFRRRQLTPWSS